MATGGTNLTTQVEENRVHLFRLQMLIIDGGLLVLRHIFDNRLTILGITLPTFLKRERSAIKTLRSRGVITKAQYDLLFPPRGIIPSTSDMDISLMICLLRNLQCFGLSQSFNWSKQPAVTDITMEADICRLQRYRNNISHISTTTGIQHNAFVNWWNDIEQLLIRQSPPTANIQQIISDLNTCPLDKEGETRIQKEIEKWKEYRSDVAQLKGEITEVREHVCDLKECLDEVTWRQRHGTIQLSPLFEEKDTPLPTFYVRPEMKVKQADKRNEMYQFRIISLTDLFRSRNESNREIYLTADAGIGKTTFSKYLAISWCQAHCPNKEDAASFNKDDITGMSKFEFVFVVFLRDSDNLCSIDDLIFELVISTLAHSGKFDRGFLQEVLNRENCLIILDGLDEWTHPENPGKPCNRSPRSIPHRNDRETCTVLTTTRPWKLRVLNVGSSALGKHVELTKLSRNSALTLTKRALQKLKSFQDEDSIDEEVEKINENIHDIGIVHLSLVPLLLMYIICLWCDGVAIGKSKLELYVKVVELLLSRTISKHGDIQSSRKAHVGVPEWLTGHKHCIKFFPFLVALGNLAYHALLDGNKESTLVFERSITELYCTEEDMKLSLLSGILTEHTTRTNTKQISKISFSHKTVQELFAAIFISNQSDGQKMVTEYCTTVQNILDVSTVCQFISGMDSEMWCEISEGLMPVIEEDENTVKYRTSTDHGHISTHLLYHIHNMAVSCLKEITESGNIKLCLHDLFYVHTADYLIFSTKLKRNNIKSLTIDMSKTSKVGVLEIMEPSFLNDLNHLQKLYIKGRGQTISFEILQHGLILKYLHIESVSIPHDRLSLFFNLITSKSTLQEVTLYGLYCKEHGNYCGRLHCNFFSKVAQLTKLELQCFPPLELNMSAPSLVDFTLRDIHLGKDSLLLSHEMVNIKHVKLLYINISSESLHHILNVLEQLPHSVSVNMTWCRIRPEEERERFRSYILSAERFDMTFDVDHKGGWCSLMFNTKYID